MADPLMAPPLDPLFFSSSSSSNPDHHADRFASDLTASFNFEDNLDLGIDFDDLDSLYFPSATESFPLPDAAAAAAAEEENSGVSGGDVVGKYFNCDSDESGTANCSAAGGSPSSSRGSGNGRSTVENAPSPDSGSSETKAVKKRKVKDEDGKKVGLAKGKTEAAASGEQSRRQKCSRVSEDSDGLFAGEEDEKKKARLMRNRESAQLSRQRKKHYVEELEDKVRAMHSTITDLNGKISYFMAENASLRHQLGGNGRCPPPPPPPQPMYPPPMAGYPWMPCAPYVVKPQGSQVPLVPIPRLKPQQPVAKSKKVGETKKKSAEPTRTKKVASVSFLGLLFFILMVGGLVPLVNVKYGENNVAGDRSFADQNFHGRVLVVDGHSNRSSGKMDVGFSTENINGGMHCDKGKKGRLECDKTREGGGPENGPKGAGFVHPDNSSEQLHASLYVPRNDKLVKIDGNLIIHSVLASERTKRSNAKPKETSSLAVSKDLSAALAIPDRTTRRRLYRTVAERRKAIGSRSADSLKEQFKSSAADGKLQQWFHQGLAGPMLSSGVCSEVFQFDVSPSPGAIVTASPVTNLTGEGQHKKASPPPPADKKKHRRILHGLPIPFSTSNHNVTGDQQGRKNETYNIKPPASSMVVSVLVDPREVGDSEIDGFVAPKSLSRVFVVVLVDSVKYVTYSCVLPRSSPHLVRA